MPYAFFAFLHHFIGFLRLFPHLMQLFLIVNATLSLLLHLLWEFTKIFFRAETGVFWSDVEMIQQMILRTQLHTLVIFTKKELLNLVMFYENFL